MKNVLTRILSTIIFLALFVISSFAQSVSKTTFDEIVDEMICDFTDLSLKEQRGQPHYQEFNDKIKLQCDYYGIRPFLRELDPAPAQTLEIVNMLHHEYKERYNSKATNQRLHNILAGVFEEDHVIAFSQNHPSSFPGFKTDWEGRLREHFMLNIPQKEEEIVNETLPKIDASNEFEETQSNPIPIEKRIDSPDDYTTDLAEEVESSNGLGNSFLLFGFLFLLLAFALYFLYQRNKDAISKKLAGINKKPKPPTPIVTNKVSKKKTPAKSNNWFNSKPKKETYADKIVNLQTLIQNQKNILFDIKEDIFKMHHEISDLTENAGFEVIDEHIKQLSRKLDEVEQKQKDLILVLDTQLDDEEIEVGKDELITDINEQEELLEDTSHDLESKITTRSADSENVNENNFSHEIPIIQIRKLNSPPDLFFMPVPNKDGSFDVENWTAKFEDTESVYRFEMINNYEAKFKFYNENKTVRRAISGYDIYIKPVCKALNAFNTNATEIKTQVDGVVYRDGDIWKLKEKALVYYQ